MNRKKLEERQDVKTSCLYRKKKEIISLQLFVHRKEYHPLGDDTLA